MYILSIKKVFILFCVHISYNHLDSILYSDGFDTHHHPFEPQFFYSELFNMVYY